MRRAIITAGLAALVWGCLGAGRAEAIPIIYGHGESITFLADLPADSPARQAGEHPLERPTKLGYKYWRLHIFWADLWTSDWEFVVYQSDAAGRTYFKLGNDAQKAALLVGMKEAGVAPPLLYTFPLGWWIISGFIVLGIVLKLAENAKPPTVADLLADPRYQKAFEAMNLEGQPADKVTTSEIQRGIERLVERGIPREEAERNLALVLEFLREHQVVAPPEPPETNPAGADGAVPETRIQSPNRPPEQS